jgi:hypothetical protein
MCQHQPEAVEGSRERSADPVSEASRCGLSRRGFLGGLSGAAALGALAMAPAAEARAAASGAKKMPGLPPGKPLRVQPVLVYGLPQPREKTSWRGYGGLQTPGDVDQEIHRITEELKALSAEAEFPIQTAPLARVTSDAQAKEVAARDCDAILVYAASGGTALYATLAASQAPNAMFLRHKSGPYYLWHEIAHWRLLRRNGDLVVETNIDVDDIVVDDYAEVVWRLRALYGLKNAKGTKMLAIGGLRAYSKPGQEIGPGHAKEVWGYEIETMTEEQFGRRLEKARADEQVMSQVERQTDALLAQPNVTLKTERRFVVNSLLAWHVCQELLSETGATNFGFANCMGSTIKLLDTAPCLVLSLANDEGYTAYCHTDLTHTLPGVLLRWIAARPTFVCNSHFPHDGMFTVAHCAAPRKMNGADFEPAAIMTHFESDYGAATKVEYTKGQVVTVIIPNLRCSKWQGFRGKVVDCPSHPACRSQIDIEIDGDWRKLVREMEGFHTQVCYGDYLREVGYALKKLGKVEWQSFSEPA